MLTNFVMRACGLREAFVHGESIRNKTSEVWLATNSGFQCDKPQRSHFALAARQRDMGAIGPILRGKSAMAGRLSDMPLKSDQLPRQVDTDEENTGAIE